MNICICMKKEKNKKMIFVVRLVVLYLDKYYGIVEQYFLLIIVNVVIYCDEINKFEIKIYVLYYYYCNKIEYVIKVIIFVLFGIVVVLLLIIFYVYIC